MLNGRDKAVEKESRWQSCKTITLWLFLLSLSNAALCKTFMLFCHSVKILKNVLVFIYESIVMHLCLKFIWSKENLPGIWGFFFSRWLILMMSLTQWKQTSLRGSTKGIPTAFQKASGTVPKGDPTNFCEKGNARWKDPQVDLERLVVPLHLIL